VSPKTTLPWLFSSVGAPSWLIPLLVPIKESGSLLPQWSIYKYFPNSIANRTFVWKIGASIQAFCSIFLAMTVDLFSETVLALVVLLLISIFSIGRALCSLSMKDIQADVFSKGERGQFVGYSATISAAVSLLLMLLLIITDNKLTIATAQLLVLAAGVLFFIAVILSAPLKLNIQPQTNELQLSLFSTIVSTKLLRNIVISRVLLMHSSLVFPFVILATTQSETFTLPYFIGLSAFASLISSSFWGLFSDRSALLSLKIAALICSISTIALCFTINNASNSVLFALFFLLTLGYAGIRASRKTYLLDITDENNRASYVSSANTLVGMLLVTTGVLYALLSNYIGNQVIYVMTSLVVVGWLHSYILPAEK
jgi:hypothetical protein